MVAGSHLVVENVAEWHECHPCGSSMEMGWRSDRQWQLPPLAVQRAEHHRPYGIRCIRSRTTGADGTQGRRPAEYRLLSLA